MEKLLSTGALDVLCPMHLVLDHKGVIRHGGPTVIKMFPAFSPVGRNFFNLFEVKRPRRFGAAGLQKLPSAQRLHLRLRAAPHTSLKGIMVPTVGDGGEVLVNLSFGISIVDAVRDFSLKNADFAATDLAIEMLYLVEAKTAAMEASHRLNKRLEWAKIAAEEQAFTDTLTGLKNRRALHTVLERLVEATSVFAVMQIDLDHFKTINDTLGHAAGDHVLQTVARIMVAETRKQDVVARVGGDEFTVVLPEIKDEETLRNVGQRIIDQIEMPIPFEGTDCRISASIGTVWIQTDPVPSMEALLADADVALYASKNAGRARQTLYSPELREAASAVGVQAKERGEISQ